MPKLGRLYVFEGCDGSGKTTLAKAFYEFLASQKYSARYFAFPGKTVGTLGHHVHTLHHDPKSSNIESIHPASLQMLHIAAHVDNIEAGIMPALKRHEWVVLDRFWWSTWVYGIATDVSRCDLELMIQLESAHWKSMKPTAVFLVKRKSQQDRSQWRSQIESEYNRLARREMRNVPVYHINNDGPLQIVLRRVIDRAGLLKL